MNEMKKSKIRLTAIGLGAFLMMFCHGMVNNSMTYFTLEVTGWLGCAKTAFSVYKAVISVCTAVMSVVCERVGGKYGLKKTMAASCAGMTAGFIMLAGLHSLWTVYTAAAVIGIAQVFMTVPVVRLIQGWFEENSSMVTGIVMSATGFGGMALGIVIPCVILSWGWRIGYMVCGAMVGLSALLACFLVKEVPSSGKKYRKSDEMSGVDQVMKAGRPDQKNDEADFVSESRIRRTLLTRFSFWILMATAFVFAGAGMISQHFAAFLQLRGYSVSVVGIVTGTMAFSLAVFKILEGLLCQALSVRHLAPILFLCGAVGYLALLGNRIPFLVAGVLGYGCQAAGCTVLYPIILRELYGWEAGSTGWGVCWAVFMAAHASWTLLYAWILDTTGSCDAGLILAAICSVAGVIGLSWLFHFHRF